MITKMTVIFQNDRYIFDQNVRCMTKITAILDQNYRYQNDRYLKFTPK